MNLDIVESFLDSIRRSLAVSGLVDTYVLAALAGLVMFQVSVRAKNPGTRTAFVFSINVESRVVQTNNVYVHFFLLCLLFIVSPCDVSKKSISIASHEQLSVTECRVAQS